MILQAYIPEGLTESTVWSINKQVVTVYVVSAWSHYEDK
ncbi:hypothetical protein C900_04633 [Fulvivirga imtechensis AK7]|uniref:Uncharacterized protein n=1 Tax=Fulvivirga imtechensis AK7 TaxID=1237149 RepID=L8JLI9_9BACT|nr:hypothetical protein C900_04633 [Fulvivirga imtechensis AK7]